MVYLVAIAIAFAIGLVVGRWWALLAGIGFAIWIGISTDVDEVPPWLLALGYGVLTVGGIAAGVVARRALGRGT